MALREMVNMMTDSITIAPYRRGNAYTEDDPWGEPVPMKAKIMGSVRLFMDKDGRQVACTQKIILGKKIEVEMRDRVTLIGRDPSTPIIVGIEKVSDEHGFHHTVLFCS